MLMALLVLSLLGAGAYEVFSSNEFGYVEQAIEEQDRADRAVMIMRRINRLNGRLEERRAEISAELTALNREQSTSAADYQRVFDELWQAREEIFGDYQADVFQLRDQMTRQEWEKAFANRIGNRQQARQYRTGRQRDPSGNTGTASIVSREDPIND